VFNIGLEKTPLLFLLCLSLNQPYFFLLIFISPYLSFLSSPFVFFTVKLFKTFYNIFALHNKLKPLKREKKVSRKHTGSQGTIVSMHTYGNHHKCLRYHFNTISTHYIYPKSQLTPPESQLRSLAELIHSFPFSCPDNRGSCILKVRIREVLLYHAVKFLLFIIITRVFHFS